MIFWSYSFYVLSQKLHLQKPIYRRNQQFTTVCPWLVTCNYTPDFVCWSFQTLVQPSVTLLFWGFWGLWPHCSCPSDQVTSDTAPAHSHRTWVAMYLSLFKHNINFAIDDKKNKFFDLHPALSDLSQILRLKMNMNNEGNDEWWEW